MYNTYSEWSHFYNYLKQLLSEQRLIGQIQIEQIQGADSAIHFVADTRETASTMAGRCLAGGAAVAGCGNTISWF
jgi:hypothetical protein